MTFDEELPKHCPPGDASDVEDEDIFYRATETEEVTEGDFKSWVRLDLKPKTEKNCKCWGLSVWREIEAVHHAREVIPSIAEKYIACGSLNKGDGKWLPTPSKSQPQHCTLWNDIRCNLPAKFQIVLSPVPEE